MDSLTSGDDRQPLPLTLSAVALGAGATGAQRQPQLRRLERRPAARPVSYINGDAGKNADVDPNSSCYNPDQYDKQKFSALASGNPGDNNVHNDACFLDDRGNKVGKNTAPTFVASSTGCISACPDPDGAGPAWPRRRRQGLLVGHRPRRWRHSLVVP